MFTVKEVANNLQLSTQAIYKQIPRLKKEGKAYSESNILYITQEGYNELQSKRVANKSSNRLEQVVQTVGKELQDLERVEKKPATVSIELYNIVQEQLKDMQNQRDYFKSLYEQKDKAFNDIVNQRLLTGTTEGQNKITFWNRLFNKA